MMSLYDGVGMETIAFLQRYLVPSSVVTVAPKAL